MGSPDLVHCRPTWPSQSTIREQLPLATVESQLSVIGRGQVDELSVDSLKDGIHWCASIQARVEAIKARWLAELDRRDRADVNGIGGPLPDWLADTLHISPGAAYAQTRTARTLDSLPETSDRLARGSIN